jgi:DNA-binding GntR family transcriptional regulator
MASMTRPHRKRNFPTSGACTPIVRQNLHDVIVTRIRDMIIEGALAPGERIHEGNLGEELGVSRTPLREALKFLASEGLLELSPRRGATVKRFSPKDVQDTLFLIGELEALAGRLACTLASDVDIANVRATHDRMIQMYKAKNRLPYFKLNQSIHTAIVQLSANGALATVHSSLQSRLRRIRYIGHEGPQKWAGAIADHEQIIVALERRDADGLGKALICHMQHAWQRVKDGV